MTGKRHHLFSPAHRFHTTYHVLQGKRPGPVVLVTAGIHGTEIAGVRAAQRLCEISLQRGTLLVFPLVNSCAFRLKRRGEPDLNRTFPKWTGDSARHPISQKIFAIAKLYRPNWCIDMHEANGFYRLNRKKLGQTIIVYPNKEALDIAKRVRDKINRTISVPSKKFDIRQGKLPGSLRTSMGQVLGCRAVTIETSMQQKASLRILYQTKIIEAFLFELGMI